jgi:hypothetical protein
MRKFPLSLFKEFPEELAVLKKLRTPGAIQDHLNGLRMNIQKKHTYSSPLIVLKKKKAHCMEGAMLAAAALWLHARPPLILDLKTTDDDADHVIALFKEGSRWGAITKTNHAVLRYRDAVYRDPREIVMSYFNEYFLDSGVKTLRSYSTRPLDLSTGGDEWLVSSDDLLYIAEKLDFAPHTSIMKKGEERRLRLADPIEIAAGKIVEWKI